MVGIHSFYNKQSYTGSHRSAALVSEIRVPSSDVLIPAGNYILHCLPVFVFDCCTYQASVHIIHYVDHTSLILDIDIDIDTIIMYILCRGVKVEALMW